MPPAKRTTTTPKTKKSAARAKPAAAGPKKAKSPSGKTKATATKAAAPKKAAASTRAAKTSKSLAPVSPARTILNPARRAIFIDVENTSNEESLSRVIEALKIDHAAQPTELFAFGNWRAVGQTMSRHLARRGATLVHTSPVTGVKDWSDLWIAVAAGRWIALAKPGDTLEIVSNDKAFEAVGDAAATAGVIFRRVLHRLPSGAAAAAAAAAESDDGAAPRRRRRRGGRGRRRPASGTPASSREHHAPAREPAPARESSAAHEGTQRPEPRRRQESPRREPRRHEAAKPPTPKAEAAAGEAEAKALDASGHGDGHGASHDQVLATIRRLTNNDPNRWVNLDLIASALKAEGFTRPPGSTRLVVRLRRMKDVEVQPNGMVRLTS